MIRGCYSLAFNLMELSFPAPRRLKRRAEGEMKLKERVICLKGIVLVVLAGIAMAQSEPPLRLEKSIPLPNVAGRIDHLSFDTETERLFVAALGNNTVEVVDIKNSQAVKTISGLAEPQGVLYQPEKRRLWVANGADGTVRVFDAQTFTPVQSIKLDDDADNIRRDAATQRIYVGHGSGAIAVFDAEANKVADIRLDAHPESFQLEKNGPRMFVNLPNSHKVAVIDRTGRAPQANWTTDDAAANFPMALDEAEGRLFIVCRKPAELVVLDTASGSIVTKLPSVGDSDDVFYDAKHKRLYASGGEGRIAIYEQLDRDHYVKSTTIETVKGARTSLFVPESGRIFLAVRAEGTNPAVIRVYKVADRFSH
jgi:DNA-binding beta-propeller fold protein YncE